MGAHLEGEYFPGLKGTTALKQGIRVKDASTFGEIEIAGDEAYIGTVKFSTAKTGENATVRDKRAPGYHSYIANGAIAKGADVSTAAGGKVQTGTAGAVDIGKAINAAYADGDEVIVRPA